MPKNFLSRGLSRVEAMTRTAELTGGKPGDMSPKANRKSQARYDARQRGFEAIKVKDGYKSDLKPKEGLFMPKPPKVPEAVLLALVALLWSLSWSPVTL